MAASDEPTLPPALRALLDAGGALVRRSSSGRVVLGRAAALVPEDAVPPALGRLPTELKAARTEAVTPVAFEDVEKVLRAAWGRAPGKVLDELDPEPLAVTPSAQVHRAVRDGEAVAIKVLRPGLAAAVRNDLALLDVLAAPLRAVFGAMDTGAILREIREGALDQLDLEHEASTQRQVRRLLRGVEGLTIPAPDMELCDETVLVSELLPGTTLAQEGPSGDRGAIARTLVTAHVTAARAGLVLTDPRPGHVVLLPAGGVGLLGAGLARPIERDRVTAGLQTLVAWRAGDQDAFAAQLSQHLKLLPSHDAIKAYALSAVLLGDLLTTTITLDTPALAGVLERASDHLSGALSLAASVTPDPHDVAVARSVVQLALVLARLGAEEDWGALILGA